MLQRNDSLSLYLHIPFCSTKCTYCAFNTYTNLESLIQPFTFALAREIEIVGASQPGQQVGTIFFGGGTPSLLTPGQIDTILNAARRAFVVREDGEISLEANPNDVTREYLEQLRAVGINRLSIGMQSAIASELRLFARRHDNDAVVRAVSAARAAGFDNVNLDLIYGVPHQTVANWEATLTQALALKPEHISLYALGLEEGTPMHAWVEHGRLPAPDDDLAADMYDVATQRLATSGYTQYEISNWAKPGRQCRHNLQYWYNLPYVGVGPGAHGYAGGVRYATVLSPHKYLKLMNEANEGYNFPYSPATDQAVVTSHEDDIAETLIMSLRLTQEGVKRRAFAERFGADVLDIHGETIAEYERRGLLFVDDERVRLTQEGRLLSNLVFRELV